VSLSPGSASQTMVLPSERTGSAHIWKPMPSGSYSGSVKILPVSSARSPAKASGLPATRYHVAVVQVVEGDGAAVGEEDALVEEEPPLRPQPA
jgi:hypothetical protein